MWQTQKQYGMIQEFAELLSFAQKKLTETETFTKDIRNTWNVQAKHSVGAPGEPGNTEAIMECAEAWTGIYKRIMIWRQGFQYIYTEEKYRNAIESLAAVGEKLCEIFDEMYQNCKSAVEQLNAVAAGEMQRDQMHIDLSINNDLNLDFLLKAILKPLMDS